MGGGDVLVGDDGCADAGQTLPDFPARAADQAGADQNVVGPIAKPDDDLPDLSVHPAVSVAIFRPARWSNRLLITSAEMISFFSSRVGTVTSAVA